MKYNDKYIPPAPTIKIKLRNPESLEVITDVPMLLDTGSDITLLPKSFCEKINAEISDTKFLTLESFNESTSITFYVYIEFVFLNKLFRGNFLVYDQEEGIIGRDVLNEFCITFDGKNLEWKECAP